jgi:hypothetical protein
VYLQLHLNHTTYYKKKIGFCLYPKKRRANQAFFERKKKKSISIANCDTRYLCSFSAKEFFIPLDDADSGSASAQRHL